MKTNNGESSREGLRSRKALFLVFLFAVGAGGVGCRSMASVLQARANGEGTSQVYPVGVEKAWSTTVSTFRESGSDAIEEHSNEGYMLTTFGAGPFSWGAFAGAWIETDGAGTRVTVITMRRIATNLAIPLTESGFHRIFADILARPPQGNPVKSR